jgi:hypothetical protein
VHHDSLGEGLVHGEDGHYVRTAAAGDQDLVGGCGGEIGFSRGHQLPSIRPFAGGFDDDVQAVLGEMTAKLGGLEAA